jgi:hypothetical protein
MSSICCYYFVHTSVTTELRYTNNMSKAFFGIRREGCLGLVVIDTFPEMESRGLKSTVEPSSLVRGTASIDILYDDLVSSKHTVSRVTIRVLVRQYSREYD